MLRIMRIRMKQISSCMALLLAMSCALPVMANPTIQLEDTSALSRKFPRFIQPFVGVFGDLNSEGVSSKLTNAGLAFGSHLDFWRLHGSLNIYRYNKLKSDIGFLDNVYNYDLKASFCVTKLKDMGLSLIGTYDAGKRPMVLEQDKDKGGALLSTETGLPVLKETDDKYFLTTQLPFYGLGIGFLVKNKRIRSDVSFLEISLRYLFIDKSVLSSADVIELSPYNINVPIQYKSDGLKLKKQGLMFQVSMDKGLFGGFLMLGTRPLLYADYVTIDRLKPIQSSLITRFSLHFKIL